jgi:uncharacterized protein YraI
MRGSILMLRLAFITALAAIAVMGLATETAAAPTARATGTLSIHSGPGNRFPVIGRLPDSSVVSLSECTPSQSWCRIASGGPDGWVLGSYLVGSAAKNQVTPWRSLVDPFLDHGRGFPFRR